MTRATNKSVWRRWYLDILKDSEYIGTNNEEDFEADGGGTGSGVIGDAESSDLHEGSEVATEGVRQSDLAERYGFCTRSNRYNDMTCSENQIASTI